MINFIPEQVIQSSTPKTRAMAGIAACLIAYLLLRGAIGQGPRAAHAETTEPISTLDEAVPPSDDEILHATWRLDLGHDPFSVPVTEAHGPAPDPGSPASPLAAPSTPDHTALANEARSSLKVHGVMLGVTSRVMLNDKVYTTGDTVEGFRIVEIGSKGIVVERQGVHVTVQR